MHGFSYNLTMTMQHTMHAMTLDAHLARATSAHPVELPSVKSNYSEEMTRAGVVGPWDAQIGQCHQISWLVINRPMHFADAECIKYQNNLTIISLTTGFIMQLVY